MADKKQDSVPDIEALSLPKASADRSAAAAAIVRRAHELRKPKDWQDFQARCVILFQDELRDPHCKEYGRSGQKQGGIDILGRREGGARYVGIQCRRVVTPLKRATILKDCREALELPYDFAEIIFATAAPDDTKATDDAHSVEEELRAEGRDIRVEIYGWEALEQLIARHPRASAHFDPQMAVPSQTQALDPTSGARLEAKLDQLTEIVTRQASSIESPRETKESDGEDQALHARIDTFRDLLNDGEPKLAYEKLSNLLPDTDAAKTPYATFRIKTNLASAAHELDREEEAAKLWTEAHELRPDSAQAISNLGLACLIKGQFQEAADYASDALERDSTCAGAVSLRLQALARSDWEGDPSDLIPTALKESEEAAAGLLEFHRLRNSREWRDLAREYTEKFDRPYFRHMAALAVLDRVIGDEVYLPGGMAELRPGELRRATETLKSDFEAKLRNSSDGNLGLIGQGNNAALALRIAGRYPEAIEVLQATLRKAGADNKITRLLGILQALDGNLPDGIATLETIPGDPEAQLVRAELLADVDKAAALEVVRSIDVSGLKPPHREVRAMLWIELALTLGHREQFESGIGELRVAARSTAITALFEVEGAVRFENLLFEEATERLEKIAVKLGPEVDVVTRISIAHRLEKWGDTAAASRVLEGHIDFSRPAGATKLYLRTLASARRDETLDRVWEQCSEATKSDPDVLWTIAVHAWSVGDLEKAEALADQLNNLQNKNLGAILLKLSVLARQDRVREMTEILERPLEQFSASHLSDRFRAVQFFQQFGFVRRAAALAYELFLGNRDQSRAWMTLANVVLARGQSPDGDKAFEMDACGVDAAVNVRMGNGSERFFVIEANANLRALDADALEPEHELASAVADRKVGDEFELPSGTLGEILQVRHKIVARFHDIVARYEERFPTVFGFQSFAFDVNAEGGLDPIIEKLKDRHDFVSEETLQYVNGELPLAVLAYRVGVDLIDAAGGVVSSGHKIKVCSGQVSERLTAARVIRANGKRGCILDPLAFWNAYRLDLLECIQEVAGPIKVARRTLDVLRDRRVRLLSFVREGYSSMEYQNGKIALTDVPSDAIAAQIEQVRKAEEWCAANAEVLPVHAPDALPEVVREFLIAGRSDMLDECILAFETTDLLISDDAPMRQMALQLGAQRAVWTQAILVEAVERGILEAKHYARVLGQLLQAGQSYLGVSSQALVAALQIDLDEGAEAPGQAFRSLAGALGGKLADPKSHAGVVLEAIALISANHDMGRLRSAATGLLLRSVIRERRGDYRNILRAIIACMKPGGRLMEYTAGWLIGHFIRL